MDADEIRKQGYNKQFTEGDDVPTVIGLGLLASENARTMKYAQIYVDYSSVREDLRESYGKAIDESWEGKHFHKGFDLNRTSDTVVMVSSKRQALSIEFGGGQEGMDVLKAPSFFVNAVGGVEPINQFFEAAQVGTMWVLHLRTVRWSYIWIVSYPSGDVLNSFRNPPITVVEKDIEEAK